MNNKYSLLINCNIWIEVSQSQVSNSHQILKKRWVYKVKISSITEYKTHWVIKKFEQQHEVNYFKIFAAVVKSMSYKTVFALAAHHDWKIHQMNIKSVFLYENLDEKIYMKLLNDYEAENDVVCKLQKFIYDFKQAS